MPPSVVRVEGLRELRLQLKRASQEFPKELKRGLDEVGGIVVREAKPRIPMRSGRSRGSVRSRSTQREGRVVFGGARSPQAGWLEFGGVIRHHGPRHSHKRAHRISRPKVPQGRYLGPAAERKSVQIFNAAVQVVERMLRKAGLR